MKGITSLALAVGIATPLTVGCKPQGAGSQVLQGEGGATVNGVRHEFTVQTKGFIAPIKRIGTLPGRLSGVRLQSFAKFTNFAFSENPQDGELASEQFRLWAELRFAVICKGGKIAGFEAISKKSDAGYEPSSPRLRKVALRAKADEVLGKADREGRFFFAAAGRPPIEAEPGFQAIGKRLNTTIWYTVEGQARCEQNDDASISIPRSQVHVTAFPSTRLWVSKASPAGFQSYKHQKLHEWVQGDFANLWRLPDVPGGVPQWPTDTLQGASAQFGRGVVAAPAAGNGSSTSSSSNTGTRSGTEIASDSSGGLGSGSSFDPGNGSEGSVGDDAFALQGSGGDGGNVVVAPAGPDPQPAEDLSPEKFCNLIYPFSLDEVLRDAGFFADNDEELLDAAQLAIERDNCLKQL